MGRHEDAHHDRRRDPGREPFQRSADGRDRRTAPSREVGWDRVPGRPVRRADPGGRAHLRRLRRLRRVDIGPALQARVDRRSRPGRGRLPERQALRSPPGAAFRQARARGAGRSRPGLSAVRAPRLTRAAASILAGLAVGAGAVAAGAGGALDRVEGDTIDLRFDVRGARPAPDVVVVAIDDVTFGELNQRWPFPRALHARAIDRLRAAGAGQIAYDVQFTEPTDERNDNALFEAVARGGHVVLSTTEVARGGRSNVLGGDANLRSIGARAA